MTRAMLAAFTVMTGGAAYMTVSGTGAQSDAVSRASIVSAGAAAAQRSGSSGRGTFIPVGSVRSGSYGRSGGFGGVK